MTLKKSIQKALSTCSDKLNRFGELLLNEIESVALIPNQLWKYFKPFKHKDTTVKAGKHGYFHLKYASSEKDGISLSMMHGVYGAQKEWEETHFNKPTIVTFNGNGDTHRKMNRLVRNVAGELGWNTFGFNYRNTDFHHSFKRPEQDEDLKQDCIHAIESLKAKGIDYKNMYLYGFSLGGGTVMSVVDHYAENGIYFPVIVNRSFRSIPSVVEAWHDKVSFRPIKSILAFAKNRIAKTRLSLNSEKRLQKIANLPQMQGKIFVMNANKDLTIQQSAALANTAIDNGVKYQWYHGSHCTPLFKMNRVTTEDANADKTAEQDAIDFYRNVSSPSV